MPPADPEGARRAVEDATHGLRGAAARQDAARTTCAALDRLGAEALTRTRELAPARAGYARLRRMADLATGAGENTLRMELETYVLAARLEQVAAAASLRLQRMSSGRYTLVHTDARASRGVKSGLGLMAVDAWTGTERDTATLSGGETFFASLALALGLADVVTDEAGGPGWTPFSSTRDSAASTSRPSTRCWTCSTGCASGTARSASSAMSRTCGSAFPRNCRWSRGRAAHPCATARRASGEE